MKKGRYNYYYYQMRNSNIIIVSRTVNALFIGWLVAENTVTLARIKPIIPRSSQSSNVYVKIVIVVKGYSLF